MRPNANSAFPRGHLGRRASEVTFIAKRDHPAPPGGDPSAPAPTARSAVSAKHVSSALRSQHVTEPPTERLGLGAFLNASAIVLGERDPSASDELEQSIALPLELARALAL